MNKQPVKWGLQVKGTEDFKNVFSFLSLINEYLIVEEKKSSVVVVKDFLLII
jgi:DUF917 family protein